LTDDRNQSKDRSIVHSDRQQQLAYADAKLLRRLGNLKEQEIECRYSRAWERIHTKGVVYAATFADRRAHLGKCVSAEGRLRAAAEGLMEAQINIGRVEAYLYTKKSPTYTYHIAGLSGRPQALCFLPNLSMTRHEV
jgi:hypothetical protein